MATAAPTKIATITRVQAIPDELGWVVVTIAGMKIQVYRNLNDWTVFDGYGDVDCLIQCLYWGAGIEADIDVARIEAGLDRSIAMREKELAEWRAAHPEHAA